jgi:hypothetical protein
VRNIVLQWEAAGTLREFLAHRANYDNWSCAGLYLHKEAVSSTGIGCYVGKATNSTGIWARQWQHYNAYLSGAYQLPREARDSDQADWLGRPLAKSDDRHWEQFRQFLTEPSYAEKLARSGFRFAGSIQLFLWRASKQELESVSPGASPADQLDLLERKVIWQLNPPGNSKRPARDPLPDYSIDSVGLDAPA